MTWLLNCTALNYLINNGLVITDLYMYRPPYSMHLNINTYIVSNRLGLAEILHVGKCKRAYDSLDNVYYS